MLLMELFTQPVEYRIEVNDDSSVVANFSIDKVEYEVVADRRSASVEWFNSEHDADINDLWEILFTANMYGQRTYNITQTGNAATVFATVIEFIKQIVSEKNLDAIAVSTYKTEQTRLKLYRRMANTLADKFGWRVVEDENVNPDSVIFILYKERQ